MRINAVYASRDPNRAGVVLEAMGANNIAVTIAQRSKEVLGLLANRSCDLLLVGQKLADEDGVTVVKNLRARGPTRTLPIIALVEHADLAAQADLRPKTPYAGFYTTAPAPGSAGAPAAAAPKEKVSLRLAFFQAGADECLSLNWDVAECVARIKAVLRRIQINPSEEIIKMGEVELNLTSYTVHVAGKQVSLTSKELDLLYVFLSSANRVLSRPYLIERVWGYNYFGSPRTVDVHVRRLREKLGKASRFITTIPCVGYKLVPPGADMRR
ncbi:MAG: response regulator transcription factor [Elusimicrobia bacterium]|nr:response regulator transcription factor [Elusimicrobiota bacterium]